SAQVLSRHVARQLERKLAGARKDSHQQRICPCFSEQRQQIESPDVEHTSFICQPRFRISVNVLENRQKSGYYFLPPSDDFRNKVFGKRTAVLVQTGKKLLNVHDDCQSNIWKESVNRWPPFRANGFAESSKIWVQRTHT